MSEPCRCGHPPHHHHPGCATTTVSGFASEIHHNRIHTRCDCTGYRTEEGS